ncbi:Ugd Predicted UDP-glucose 6-dehydrogenase [uncultured Caudovirales phage]|uniref:UDP-glucose 6-dehydrogenase n=1 Tax=uncultured Caudovirales phage TaxID=2100421 RepID=A0A6J5RS11_9CAUD|nr:Ugd Predicted UDP-glucose 6-dehydrogenase [uncultured Caudovirales phage]
MKICVQGLWHLGTVTAACLASLGHNVVGIDFDKSIIKSLNNGIPTFFEPGLENLVKQGLISNNLTFASETENINFLWVTYDTPVDDNDNADINFVFSNIELMIPFLSVNAIVLISSQLPIGSIKYLEDKFKTLCPEKNISFACSPENLRLGNALNIFLKPDRIIVGVRTEKDKLIIKQLLESISSNIEWMSVESAEMTKHAINSFLATSVVFANEIASICEITGANAKEVERGLKSESRIGPKAYLSPGVSFSGGTLARDINFLQKISKQNKLKIPLLKSVKTSNNNHKLWSKRKINSLFPNLKGITITIWGIAYKENTDILRRSLNVELCNWLLSQGANIKVYDPFVENLPKKWLNLVQKSSSLDESLINSNILIIGTKNDKFKHFFEHYSDLNLTVIDPNRFIPFLENSKQCKYISVGI